jgi:hypothetical protein
VRGADRRVPGRSHLHHDPTVHRGHRSLVQPLRRRRLDPGRRRRHRPPRALKEAWESGARTWAAADRQRFANDLAFGQTLLAVTDNANSAKQDGDPAQWMPPLAANHCNYAIAWVQVKYRWRLTVDAAERTRLTTVLSGACGQRTVPIPTRAR